MKKQFILVWLSLITSLSAFSQEVEEKEPFIDNYIGLQVNELLRQILNLNTSTVPTSDYYLNYAVNHHKTGWGLNLGFGYNYRNIHEGDAINKQETKIDAWAFRVGPEKKFRLGKRLLLGVGIDYFVKRERNKSTVRIEDTFDQFTETVLEEGTNSTGLGPRLSISYTLSKWILVGTETSYYFSMSNTYQEGVDRTSFLDLETYQEFEDEFDEQNLVFIPPAIIYLIITF